MRNTAKLVFASLMSFAAACTAEGTGDADTEVYGQARYTDAETEHDGTSREPARPAGAEIEITIEVEGTGQMEGLAPECALDGATGSFNGLLTGDASADDDGFYLSSMTSSTAVLTTPGGCEIPELSVSAVTEVTVRGAIEATSQQCETYCAAKARHHAEGVCGADSDAASCRGAAEADYHASCTTSCTTEAREIVAETKLSADAVAAVNAEGLTGVALGQVEIDLVFDSLVDGSGEAVTENQ